MSIRILVVASEAIEAGGIANSLHQMGYEVIEIATSGEAAIEQSSAADLVLIDVKTQGEIDGIAAAQAIYAKRSIPIIYFTDSVDQFTLQRMKTLSTFGYLLKPFGEEELRVAIDIAWTRYQTEQQLRQLLEQSQLQRQVAEQLSQLRSQFISIVAHEFRTPLSVIKVAIEVLEHYQLRLSPEKQQRHFQRIAQAIDEMNQLLEDVLMLGQIETGVAFTSQSIEVVSFCQQLIEAQGSDRIELIDQVGSIQVNLDEKLMRQLLNNLISNAIKYSPEDSRITLRLFQQAEFLYLEVQDFGIGILAAELDLVFEPFQRGSNVGKISGTGLGLAIAKRAVDLHRGTILVTSTPTEGTTFTIALPLTSNP